MTQPNLENPFEENYHNLENPFEENYHLTQDDIDFIQKVRETFHNNLTFPKFYQWFMASSGMRHL